MYACMYVRMYAGMYACTYPEMEHRGPSSRLDHDEAAPPLALAHLQTSGGALRRRRFWLRENRLFCGDRQQWVLRYRDLDPAAWLLRIQNMGISITLKPKT